MAASPSPASRSPLRMGGIALLGVGVIAAFAGLISTTQGDGNGTVAQAPTSSAQVLDPTAEAALPTAPASPAPDAAATAPFVPGSTADGRTGDGAASGLGAGRGARAAARRGSARARPDRTRRHRRRRPPARRLRRAAGSRPLARPCASTTTASIPGLGRPGRRRLPQSAGWTVDEVGGYPGAGIPDEHGLLPARARPSRRAAKEIGRAVRAAAPSRGSPGSRAPARA